MGRQPSKTEQMMPYKQTLFHSIHHQHRTDIHHLPTTLLMRKISWPEIWTVNTQGKIPNISLWISELIQNALDSTWGDGAGGKVELDFSESSFTFSHDGRPPQYLGFNKNGFVHDSTGSTKRADLSKEGRFGIGFKY